MSSEDVISGIKPTPEQQQSEDSADSSLASLRNNLNDSNHSDVVFERVQSPSPEEIHELVNKFKDKLLSRGIELEELIHYSLQTNLRDSNWNLEVADEKIIKSILNTNRTVLPTNPNSNSRKRKTSSDHLMPNSVSDPKKAPEMKVTSDKVPEDSESNIEQYIRSPAIFIPGPNSLMSSNTTNTMSLAPMSELMAKGSQQQKNKPSICSVSVSASYTSSPITRQSNTTVSSQMAEVQSCTSTTSSS